MGKIKNLVKFMPYKLSDSNKLVQLTTIPYQLPGLILDQFFDGIITCDGKLVLYYNFKRSFALAICSWWAKIISEPWPRTEKGCVVSFFWNGKGLVHQAILNRGQTVTADVYSGKCWIAAKSNLTIWLWFVDAHYFIRTKLGHIQ